MKISKAALLIFLGGLILYNIIMIPVLTAQARDGLSACFSFDWDTCLSAIASEGISWVLFKWVNIALLLGFLIAVAATVLLYVSDRRSGTLKEERMTVDPQSRVDPMDDRI